MALYAATITGCETNQANLPIWQTNRLEKAMPKTPQIQLCVKG
ncbi:MAG: hypothetical protein ACI8RD_002184 [Bacillariaceae sp.]|jgi:hypothetical protein